jgi:serine phosphatase RsbU (regulator of sigma subunit)
MIKRLYPTTISLRITKKGHLLPFLLSAVFLLIVGTALPQAQKSIDSLEKILATSKDKAVLFRAKFALVSKLVATGNVDRAETLNKKILANARKENDREGMVGAYQNRITMLFQRNEIDSAKTYNDTLEKLARQINNKEKIIQSLNNIGSYYYFADDYKKALTYYDSALRVEASFGFQEGEYASINNIGLIYLETNIPAMAIRYFKKSVKNAIRAKKKVSLIYAYNTMSDAYTMMGKYDSAIHYANLSLQVAQAENIVLKIATSHCGIGNAYRLSKKYDSALVHYNKALEVGAALHDVELSYNLYGGLAETYYKQNKLKEAGEMAEKLKALSGEYTIGSEDIQLYDLFSMLEYKNRNYKQAYEYLRGFIEYRDSCYNLEVSSQISEINTKYETEKKEKENQLLQTQNQLSLSAVKQQKTITYFTIGGLLITLILLYFIFKGLKNQKNANLIISEQKHLVEEKQREVLDSIHYARRIQNTLLAPVEFVNVNVPDNFILFKPKDIVSGDFYWATKKDHLFYLAVCDSTGHGVPGAFMSLLNTGFLNEAINEKNISSPDKIFDHVRERLINSISKEGQQDGFDGILLCIDLDSKKISYVAANNAPVIISNGIIVYGECDKMPVGKGERINEFSLHNLELKAGDILYLYTDGYADQFGGPKGKKFMYKKLNNLLASIATKSMEEQKQQLNTQFEDWRKEQEQVDDVCIIGIRL